MNFSASGIVVLSHGWTELYPKSDQYLKSKETLEGNLKRGDVDQQIMPIFTVGETGPHQPFIKESKTKPQKYFTENTLLATMETAGKLVDDDDLKIAMKDKGLGTPSTRAAIIEVLLSRKYILRKGNLLQATDVGRYIISLLSNKDLKSPEMTGEWEFKLKQIEKGEISPIRFMNDISKFIKEIIEDDHCKTINKSIIGNCPLCGKEIIEGKRGYGCSGWKVGCQYVMWKEYKEYFLTIDEGRELLQTNRLTNPIITQNKGNSETKLLYLSGNGDLLDIDYPVINEATRNNYEVDKIKFKSDSIGLCPYCKGNVIQNNRSYGCSNWKNGCKFVIWRKIAGKSISKTNVKALLAKGLTPLIKGFISKNGKKFDSQLVLKKGKVEFNIF